MCVCVCVCVCVWNELEVCATLAYPHISSFCTMPVLYTSTRILKPLEDSEQTGLKVKHAACPVIEAAVRVSNLANITEATFADSVPSKGQ